MRADRESEKRTQELFLRGLLATSVICSFAWAWLTVNANEVVRIVLGPQWSAVPRLLILLCFSLLTSGLGLMSVIVTHAYGKPFVWMRYSLIGMALLVPGMLIGMRAGLPGIAVATVAAQLIAGLAFGDWAIRATNTSIGTIAGNFWPIIASALLAYGAMLAARGPARNLSAAWIDHLLKPITSPLLVVLITTPVGIAAFAAALAILKRSILQTITSAVLRHPAATVAA